MSKNIVNKAKLSNIIKTFDNYCFNNKNISRIMEDIPILKEKKKTNAIQQIKKENNVKYKDFYFPDEKDSLFWCWYIFSNGFSNYTINKYNSFTTEKQTKIKYVEELRKIKFDKKFKLKKTEIEGNLANDTYLALKSLEAILLYSEQNFIYFNNKIYYENIEFPDHKICIIWYNEDIKKYGILLNKDILHKEKNKRYCTDSYTKPLKSISNFKADEIREACKLLNIDVMKTPTKYKTKKILYQLLSEKIM